MDRKSQTSSGKSDQFVKTSERFVDSNNENMDPDMLDISLISVSESLAEEFIGNANLSAIIDPEIFDTSILSESGKGKLTNGQLVKNKSMKDFFNLENAVEAVNDNVEIGVEAISLEADQSVEGGNIESAAEALAAPPKSVKATVTVKELKRSLEVASKSVKKGKITPGQQVKNGRNNKEINDIVTRVRVTRNRTPKNYSEINGNDDICDSDEEFIPAERIVESEESDDDCRKQTRRGRPEGAKNKKSRKHTLVKDPSINDGENEEVNETGDIDKEGESGCKSPVKKKQLKQQKKDLLMKQNG